MRMQVLILAGALLGSAMPVIASSSDPAAAVIDREVIGIDEVNAKSNDAVAQENARYRAVQRHEEILHNTTVLALRESALQALIRDRALKAEAAKSGRSVDAISGDFAPKEPTEEQMRAYYAANASPSAPPYEQVRDVVRERVAAEAKGKAEADLLKYLRGKHEVRWMMPRERVAVTDAGPSKGNPSAKVTVVEFADFQCPYCGRLQPILADVLGQFPDDVRLVYRQLPIPQLHPSAYMAAQASICSDEQGHFFEMHDALFGHFASGTPLQAEDVMALGKRVGLDAEKFDSCLNSGRAKNVIDRDTVEADALGVEGTPAVFVNGRPMRGGITSEMLRDAITEELLKGAAQPR